jgi:uncharacterized protein (DUF2267 family)
MSVAVDHGGFMTIVRQHSGRSSEDAERATRATLQTLGERIDRGQARQLAAQLPPELAPWLATSTPAQPFDVDEFVLRVAAQENATPAAAVRDVAAVFTALAQAAPDEWDDVVAELPRTFAPLLPRGPFVKVIDADTFRRQVAARAGISPAEADRATGAVLETLAERIAGGEVEDLLGHLPVELHPPLKRGRAAVRGEPSSIGLDKFIHKVAEREGACVLAAMLHARAVFRVLRDALGEQQFRDIVVQLPRDYVEVLAR